MDAFAPAQGTTQNVQAAARHAAVEYLVSNGFTVTRWDATGHDMADIEAERDDCRLLAQVRATLHPDEPASPTSAEARWLEVRAERAGRMALVCRLSMVSDGKGGLQPTNIRWEPM